MKHYIGIDNGVSGAIASVAPSGLLTAWLPMPTQETRKGREVDALAVYQNIWRVKSILRGTGNLVTKEMEHELVVVIEEPCGAKSYMAAVSMAASFHSIRAVLEILRIRYHRITPQSWQKAMLHCKGGDTKPVALSLARRLWPKETWLKSDKCRTPHKGAIDAALIAEYGRRNDL